MSDLATLTEICRSKMCGPHQECDDQHPCSCRDAARAIVAAGYSRPAPAPEGWRLVPIEPTEEMKRAAFGPIMLGGRSGPISGDLLRQEATLACYRAMLASAPLSPTTERGSFRLTAALAKRSSRSPRQSHSER